MPFNFKEYEAQCSRKSRPELQHDLQHYDNVVTGASAGTGISIITAPLTMGVSLLAIGGTAPAIHNARKKRAILRRQLQRLDSEVQPPFSSAPVRSRSARWERSVSVSSNDLPPYDPSSAPADLNDEKETYDERSSSSTLASSGANTPPAYNEADYKPNMQYAPPPGPPPSVQAKEPDSRITEHEL